MFSFVNASEKNQQLYPIRRSRFSVFSFVNTSEKNQQLYPIHRSRLNILSFVNVSEKTSNCIQFAGVDSIYFHLLTLAKKNSKFIFFASHSLADIREITYLIFIFL